MFLAAAVPARAGERVLDVGAGAGVAGLCVLARVSGVHVTAVDIDKRLVALAARNAAKNSFDRHFRAIAADVRTRWKALGETGLRREGYHHLMANPPFYTASRVRAALDPARAVAHVMREGDFSAWVDFFTTMCAPHGLLTLIHLPDCLEELLCVIDGRFGDITVFPLFPRAGEAATRIIVQAKKGSRAGLSLMSGLVLHEADGRYTEAAEAVLREGAALELRRSSEGKNRER